MAVALLLSMYLRRLIIFRSKGFLGVLPDSLARSGVYRICSTSLSVQQVCLEELAELCCYFPQGHSATLAGCVLAGRVQTAGAGRATWRALQPAAGPRAWPAGGTHAAPGRATAQTASWPTTTVTSWTGIATAAFTHIESSTITDMGELGKSMS